MIQPSEQIRKAYNDMLDKESERKGVKFIPLHPTTFEVAILQYLDEQAELAVECECPSCEMHHS